MTLRTRVELRTDSVAPALLVDRVRAADAQHALVVQPASGDRAAELAAVACAVAAGVPVIETDDVDATADVVAVIEALLDAEAAQ
ncbi:MAG: hypothetical protein ACOYNI_11675 [Acidimicrobiia bacterium]